MPFAQLPQQLLSVRFRKAFQPVARQRENSPYTSLRPQRKIEYEFLDIDHGNLVSFGKHAFVCVPASLTTSSKRSLMSW